MYVIQFEDGKYYRTDDSDAVTNIHDAMWFTQKVHAEGEASRIEETWPGIDLKGEKTAVVVV